MNEGLIQKYNQKVSSKDTVYFLGDIIFGGPTKVNSILPRLNGFKYLVPGNHDTIKHLEPYFERILPPIYNLRHEGHRVVLCHFPILSWESKHHGWYHFHGHSHGSIKKYPQDAGDYHKGCDRILDVGVDNCNYEPISLQEAMDRVNGN
jgi:calcineurin-like phosphoesterase family protein